MPFSNVFLQVVIERHFCIMESLENEIWVDVENTNGRYEVNNFGEIYRKEAIYIYNNGYEVPMARHKIKPYLSKRGYLSVAFSRESNKTKREMVHRVIAKAFLPNPNELPFINHKNGIRTDNRLFNLEWVSARENNCHARHKKAKHSKYTGVHLHRTSKEGIKTWKASISITIEPRKYKLIRLGYFDTQEKAYQARKNYEKENGIINKYL